ncbi:porin family protein [Fluviicola sp.]|uniref:porin family protein n=1 Tax=Fluviicola sp. TaxID=1917219 RepID=UPI00262597BC|nr:porin family protein [Fluviicola sp.]
MKRFLIIFSLISIGNHSDLYAQNSMFDLGLEGGPNLSTMLVSSSNPAFDFDPNPAIFGSGGFIFQYNFKNFLSLKSGLSYQRKGYQSGNTVFSDASGNIIGTGKTSSRFDYLTFPVLVKASFGKKVSFFVNAGPYAGYLLSKTDRMKINKQETIYTEDLKHSGFNRWDFGIASGVGIAIPIRTYWVISVEARNYSGLTDLAESGITKWLTNTTDLRVGVAYKLGFYAE